MSKGSGGTRATNSRTAHGGGNERSLKSTYKQINKLQDQRNSEIAKIDARQNLVSKGNDYNLSAEHRTRYDIERSKIYKKYDSKLDKLWEKVKELERR